MDVAEIIPNSQEDSLSIEILQAKFKTYARENFQDFIRKDLDYIQFIKKCGQFYSFQIPYDKCELFIHSDTAPFFWLCDFPALVKFEEWLRSDAKNKSYNSDNYKSLKEFYSKWVIIQSESDKRYYALSAIKLIERDSNKVNIVKNILHAIILGYDKKLFMPEKAQELLNTASIDVSQLKIDDWIKVEFQYQINLLSGFIYLKMQLIQEANQKFSEALITKNNGITAKFYLALTDKRLQNIETTALMLGEIVEYDRTSFKVAIEMNNLNLLGYFIQNAVTYTIFSENEFSDMLDELNDIITLAGSNGEPLIQELSATVSNLRDSKFLEYINDEIGKNISFLEKIYNSLRDSKNTIIRFMEQWLKEKIDKIITMITDIFTKKFNTEMYEKLSKYDMQINDNLEAIKHLTKEIDEHKADNSKKIETTIQGIEKRINDSIQIIEKKINNIHLDKRYNPQSTFNSAMVYNFIVTLFVFIIGGFSGCYNGTINDVYNFKDVMSAVIMSGFKWGTVTFLAGMIISSFAAAFALMDRASEKQSLIKRITYLKSQKEREIELAKRENEKKLKSFMDNFNERIEEHKKNIDGLKSDKEKQFKELSEETNQKILEQTNQLKEILSRKKAE
jgi:hypothetical protein